MLLDALALSGSQAVLDVGVCQVGVELLADLLGAGLLQQISAQQSVHCTIFSFPELLHPAASSPE
jgi:hypothetical protein